MEKLIIDINSPEVKENLGVPEQCYALFGHERLSYLITDQSNQIRTLKSWQIGLNGKSSPSYLQQICQQDQKLQAEYSQASIGVQNAYHTLVPNRMFDPSRLKAYFDLLTASGKSLHYAFDDLPDFDAKLVYAVETEIWELMNQTLPNARIFHSISALLEVYRAYCHKTTFNVFVNVYHHTQQIMIFDGSELLFFNTFTFTSPSDFVYYLLLPLKQLNIDPTSVSIVVSGELIEDSDCIKIARRFVGPFRFMQLPNVFEYPGAVQSLPSHFCFDLYSVKLKK
jgi:hypothetical protein